MGKMILNGTEYSGGAEVTFANGLYLDANNIIVPYTEYKTEFYYTATEDCFVRCNVDNAVSNSGYITVDGVHVAGMWSERWNLVEHLIPLKKGQTIHVWQTDTSYSSNYSVYGVQPASNVTFIPDYASACYSSQEREVGCWVDGKPLYQKTINFGALPNNDVKDVSHGVSNIDKIWVSGGFAYQPSGNFANQLSLCVPSSLSAGWYFGANSSVIRCQTSADRTNYSAYVTVQYTKTTDVAGSGNWTPLGKPTVHYSTEEQVIGTWIDGKTLCEKVIIGISAYRHPSLMDLGIPISETIVKAEMQGIATISDTDYVVSGSTFLWSISQGQNNGSVYISKGTTNYEAYYNGASTSDVNLIIQYTKTTD